MSWDIPGYPKTSPSMYYSTLVPGLSCPGTSWDVPGYPKASQAMYYCTLVPSLSCPGTFWDIPRCPNCPLYVMIVIHSLEHPRISPRRPECHLYVLIVFYFLECPGISEGLLHSCTTALWSLVFHVLGRPEISQEVPKYVLQQSGPWSFLSWDFLDCTGISQGVPSYALLNSGP